MNTTPDETKLPMGWPTVPIPSMDLRDYFAAAAMQALMHPGYKQIIRNIIGHDVSAPDVIAGIAASAYQHSDAMLKERSK